MRRRAAFPAQYRRIPGAIPGAIPPRSRRNRPAPRTQVMRRLARVGGWGAGGEGARGARPPSDGLRARVRGGGWQGTHATCDVVAHRVMSFMRTSAFSKLATIRAFALATSACTPKAASHSTHPVPLSPVQTPPTCYSVCVCVCARAHLIFRMCACVCMCVLRARTLGPVCVGTWYFAGRCVCGGG